MKILLSLNLFITLVLVCGCAGSNKQAAAHQSTGITKQWIDRNLQDATRQYKYFSTQIPTGVMPRSFTNDTLRTCTSENWVAGFYTGTLGLLYKSTKDRALYAELLEKIPLMEKEQYNTGTHDLGFMMYCSYGTLNRISPDAKYKQVLINAARSLATRFNPKVGCIRSWGKSDDSTAFRVIIDNMMNLELLFYAARETGDKTLYNIAVTHANTTLKNHFRPNFSSYHVVVYDPKTGAVISKETAQGAADESAWARGQSWGLYGYTILYRETKEQKYLEQAQGIAGFISSNPNLPADKIPYWDYDAPGIPQAPKDASAAAIMASALIELAEYSNRDLSIKYRSTAQTILKTLSSPEYKANQGTNGGFILKHSVAHFPKKSEVDAPLPYADYYYVEALMRYKNYLR